MRPSVLKPAQIAITLTAWMIGMTLWVSTSVSTHASQPSVHPEIGAPLIATLPQAEGDTSKPAQKRGINFLSLLTQGGWFMVPLLLLSIGVFTIAIERYLALRRTRIFPPKLVDQLAILSQSENGLEPRRAYQTCQQYPSSAAYVLRSMLVKVGRPQIELENAVGEASQREANRLSQMTSWLSLAAAIAPLIGLLGTVWGITQAFYDTTQLAELNAGQNRGVALANGIYVALVTTMVGLMIAIPAAILSHFYENRIVQLLNEIEEMACNLLPQFERYEGQVRFTQGVAESTEIGNVNPAVAQTSHD
ncbi:MAG: MotA/TolQ/ExbB proton channel family protein [Mariniblastus sp.]|nr:MotA/TolQ/ExbB proton channel family protein [Mariniblastus sp.]